VGLSELGVQAAAVEEAGGVEFSLEAPVNAVQRGFQRLKAVDSQRRRVIASYE
jgi:hypothetical protein